MRLPPRTHFLAGTSVWFKVSVVLIVAASCFRIFIVFHHNPMDSLFGDMLRHWQNGLLFPRGTADPIGYQLYIFTVQRVAGSNRFLIALASSALSVFMPWTYYRAARAFGLEKAPSLWVWVLIAWTPSLIVIYRFIMMETLLLVLEGAALWMTARYLRKGGTRPFLLFVFCWTLACLTKPTVLPLAAICFLWALWKQCPSWRQMTWGSALALVMLLPSSLRNYVQLGFVAPFGNPWLTRIQLRCGAKRLDLDFYTHAVPAVGYHPELAVHSGEAESPSCSIRPLEPLSHWAMRRAWGDSKVRIAVDSAYGQRDWKAAYERFTPDAAEWLAQWRENIILFFFAPSYPETSEPEWDTYLEYLGRWLWAPLILLVFMGNARAFICGRFDTIPVTVTLYTLGFALQNIVIMEGRYRKPVEPLLLLNVVWLLCNKSSEPKVVGIGDRQLVQESAGTT